ncbi:MAG: hypothetical protein IJ068_05005 [Bacilli bacterium]|nr:hypothetical protein [Bacilli bacterium]
MENNSKQIMISILVMSLILLAVLGTTFAFFTYVKTGTTNNTVVAGEMGIYLSEAADALYLTNQFPMTNAEVLAASDSSLSGGENDVTTMTFTITGYSSGTATIPYTVYVMDGDTDDEKVRFADSEISVYISEKTTYINGLASGQTQNAVSTPTAVNALTTDSNGKIIANGVIKAGTTEAVPQIDTYKLRMIVNDTVRISDTSLSVKMAGATTESLAPQYCASDRTITEGVYIKGCKLYMNNGVLTKADNTDLTDHDWLTTYSDLYYSIRLKVIGGI